MKPSELKELYLRELDNLHKEISLFTDEKKLWEISGEVKNSAGNLCIHLLGNINHFIGAILGKIGYVRNRDEEFTLKDIPQQQLLSRITDAKVVVESVLDNMQDADINKEFPVDLIGKRSTEFMLAYFHGHLMYHLGQINYLRRLL